MQQKFNPSQDDQIIKASLMKPKKLDQLIDIITHRSNEQRQEIMRIYNNQNEISLQTEFQSNLSGNFKDAVLALFYPPVDYDYYLIKKACRMKVLPLGNLYRGSYCVGLFDEINTGPLSIADEILLSHEPVHGLAWCLNIHGHDHNGVEPYADGCRYLNLASNVCDFTPVNLGKLIKREFFLIYVTSIG